MKGQSSLMSNIADPASGTAIYDNGIIVVTNNFIDFSDYVKEVSIQNGYRFNLVQTINQLFDILNNKPAPLLNNDKALKLASNVEEYLKGLPLFYHIRLLSRFISRYYLQVLNDDNDYEIDSLGLQLGDTLVQVTNEFKSQVGVIPSPFEVVYLTCQELRKSEINIDTNIKSAYLTNSAYQKVGLENYISRFSKLFKKELE